MDTQVSEQAVQAQTSQCSVQTQVVEASTRENDTQTEEQDLMDQMWPMQRGRDQASVEVQVGHWQETLESTTQTARETTHSATSQTDEPPLLIIPTEERAVQANLKNALEGESIALIDIEAQPPIKKPATAGSLLAPTDECPSQDCSAHDIVAQQMAGKTAVSLPSMLNLTKAMHLKQQLDQLQTQGQARAGVRPGTATAPVGHNSPPTVGEAADTPQKTLTDQETQSEPIDDIKITNVYKNKTT